jgi:ABC-type transport system involved in cytochrome c biogenesis permease subunit
VAESATLQLALAAYTLAAAAAVAPWWARARARPAASLAWPLAAFALAAALALHTLALVARWQFYGHGPFTTLYEILSSNLWSLALVFALAAATVREVRPALALAAPVLLVLAAWLVVSDPGAGHFPATYDTSLLYIHTVLGKLFLGLLLVALATGGVAALAGTRWTLPGLDALRLDALAHRFAAFAFVFDTLMLVAGAVWAQDAWGRYWDWDPLESWAFATWVALALALHARATLRPAPRVFALWLLIVFVVAFLTFFGVPFISTAPHKGAV